MIEHNDAEKDEIAEAKSCGVRPLARCEFCGTRRLLQFRARRGYEIKKWVCDECLITELTSNLHNGRVIRGTASFS
jgi:hypothetical protein